MALVQREVAGFRGGDDFLQAGKGALEIGLFAGRVLGSR